MKNDTVVISVETAKRIKDALEFFVEDMEEAYTRGPWNCGGSINTVFAGKWPIAEIFGKGYEDKRATTRRIIACVNACQGISSEALEKGILTDSIAIHLNTEGSGITFDTDVEPCYEGVKVWEDKL